MVSQEGTSRATLGLVHLAIVYVVWGSTYLAIRLAVRDGSGFPPFALGALRLIVAGGILLAWGWLRGSRIRLTGREWITLGAAGLLLWPCANGLVNWSEQRVDSSYAALLVGSLPIWAAVIDAVLDRRRPTGRMIVSLLIGFAGVGLLSVPRLLAAEPADVLSICALLAVPILWGIGSAIQTRRPVGTTPVVSAAYLHLAGAVGFLVISLAAHEPLPSPSAAAWGAWAYLVVAGSIGAFTSFVRVLRLLPTSVVMTYAYVNPMIAVLLGGLLLRERLSPELLSGMALILLGVWGVFRDRRLSSRLPAAERPA